MFTVIKLFGVLWIKIHEFCCYANEPISLKNSF
jgi:hypothetical protein